MITLVEVIDLSPPERAKNAPDLRHTEVRAHVVRGNQHIRSWAVGPEDHEQVRRMPEDIALRLDRTTAEDLYVAMYEAGEHIAGDAPITPLTAEKARRLGKTLRDLDHALGRRCSPYCDHL